MSEPTSPEAPNLEPAPALEARDAATQVSEARVTQASQPRFNPFAAGVLGAFIGLIAGIGIGMNSAPKPAEARKPIAFNFVVDGQNTQTVGTPVEGDALKGAQHVIGAAGAKITMVEFSDYRCGFCRLYALQTFPLLKTEFVDTGKIRYAYRNTVIVGGEQSVAVSNAASCASDQNKFWEFHNLMFAQAERWSSIAPGVDLDNTLSSLSQQIGAKPDLLQTCLSEQRHAKAVQADNAAAGAFGVNGTPSFIINGYLFSGALPLEVYKQIFKYFGVS